MLIVLFWRCAVSFFIINTYTYTNSTKLSVDIAFELTHNATTVRCSGSGYDPYSGQSGQVGPSPCTCIYLNPCPSTNSQLVSSPDGSKRLSETEAASEHSAPQLSQKSCYCQQHYYNTSLGLRPGPRGLSKDSPAICQGVVFTPLHASCTHYALNLLWVCAVHAHHSS